MANAVYVVGAALWMYAMVLLFRAPESDTDRRRRIRYVLGGACMIAGAILMKYNTLGVLGGA